jgi:hypothetical protein
MVITTLAYNSEILVLTKKRTNKIESANIRDFLEEWLGIT